MSRRPVAILLALGAPTAAAAQVGRVTDTISGTVTGPDGRAIAGVVAQVTSLTSWETHRQTTDAGGRFLFFFYENAGRYELVVRYFGMVPVRLTVGRQADQSPLVANVRMDLTPIVDPIAAILSRRDSLGLSAAQVAQLREISDSRTLQVLERARSVLTRTQWAKLSEAQGSSASRPTAFPAGHSQEAAPVQVAQPAAPQQAVPAPRPWSLYVGVSNVYDNNIEHTQIGPESYGVLGLVGGQYRQRFSGTTVELQYDGVLRRYTNTEAWNRPGHSATASLAQRGGRHWVIGATGEVLINGSAEERVLRNEYSLRPELEYRFTRSTRLELYGEYLLKRYPTPGREEGRNSVDPRVGIRFRQFLGARGSLGMSARYNYNYADSSRYQYDGWTYGADLAVPLGPADGGRIESNVRYRIRHYTSRLVDVGATQELRRDGDLVATGVWRQTINRLWEVALSYRYEIYQSNDPDKEFRDHLVGLTLIRWW